MPLDEIGMSLLAPSSGKWKRDGVHNEINEDIFVLAYQIEHHGRGCEAAVLGCVGRGHVPPQCQQVFIVNTHLSRAGLVREITAIGIGLVAL